ncbi:MAG: uracil phosphoribosyltransferase [Bacteroidales bacterium]|jgi:uracil phosphoribosyltransferase|nr:uracil phosphoribosyltransferase [Bacteroidales bacterium]
MSIFVMTNDLSLQNSLFNQFISELRDETIQKDRMRFRRNMQRIGEIFAYEISKTLHYTPCDIQTPLGTKITSLPAEQPVICSILRAGIPLHEGVLNYFDRADNGFISAYRKHGSDGEIKIRMDYVACPEIDGRELILCDPMLATGSSMVVSYQALCELGTPRHTHIVSVVATQEAIDYVYQNIPSRNFTLWVGAIDEELTAQSYIVPGLGDAGDLAFGPKIQN